MAAVGGSISWATCSVFFTEAVRRLGVWALNLVRLVFAVLFLSATLWVVNGIPFVVNATGENWLYLGLSAVIGLSIGDLCYFKALGSLGPRLGLLLMSLAPIFAAAEGYLFLSEKMSIMSVAGMFIALFGIGWVATEKRGSSDKTDFHISVRGVLFGVFGAVCQATGLFFSKLGLRNLDPLSGTFIRMSVAVVVFAAILLIAGRWQKVRDGLSNKSGIRFAFGGAFFGPFIGVTLSLVAVKHTKIGVAMTLLSTMPVTVLPYSVLVYRERLTVRRVLGAALAVIG
ncbi:MAG: DMT family transporter, partial [Planctomycetota bacterium]|nr:DMT family transporter [Planctomycetota bacterium]